MPKKEQSEMRKKINEMHEENEYYNVRDNTRSRARSILVGNGYGGMIEITLRNEHNILFALMQPVEAVEIIEQLAAGCGIEIAMRPKQNFTSWRAWHEESYVNPQMKGTAPYQLEGNSFQFKINEIRGETELEVERQRSLMWKEKELEKIRNEYKIEGQESVMQLSGASDEPEQKEDETPQKKKRRVSTKKQPVNKKTVTEENE